MNHTTQPIDTQSEDKAVYRLDGDGASEGSDVTGNDLEHGNNNSINPYLDITRKRDIDRELERAYARIKWVQEEKRKLERIHG